ncbi:unnamed protein product [Sphagnum jensenii]|uniref:Uncharacterized protein n=1 Tax=Sphagnum jensenii TaxID=128206 RepID=A0ABP0X175_9BRYO
MSGFVSFTTGFTTEEQDNDDQVGWDCRTKVHAWDPKCKLAGPCKVVCCGVRPLSIPPSYDLSLRLQTWDTHVADPCPQLAGECGGTWVAPGQHPGPMSRLPVFALDLAPCDDPGSPPSPNSPKVRVIPTVSKKLVLASRDKQSLLEEITDLKLAVADQQVHIRHHKIQAAIIELENRKMLKDIEDMEKPNAQCRSTQPQGTIHLRQRIHGLKTKIGGLQARSEAQSAEIHRLRTDSRITHTREIEFERDVFLGEIGRLTLLVKRLKALCAHTATLENRDDIGPMTEKAKQLEEENMKLEIEKESVEKELERTEHNLKVNRARANEHIMEAKSFEKKCKDMETKNIRMAAAIERTKKSNKVLAIRLKKTEKAFKKAKRKGRFF